LNLHFDTFLLSLLFNLDLDFDLFSDFFLLINSSFEDNGVGTCVIFTIDKFIDIDIF